MTKIVKSTDMAKIYTLPSIHEKHINDIHIENVALTNEGVRIDYAIGSGDCSDFLVESTEYNEWLESENLLHCEWLGNGFDLCDYWNNTDYDVRLIDAKLFVTSNCIDYVPLPNIFESLANILKPA